MDYKEINTLIFKFQNGETSLEEEKMLQKFFLTNSEVPAELKPFCQYFLAMNQMRNDSIADVSAEQVKKVTELKILSETKPDHKSWFGWKVGLAASLIILLSVSSLLLISYPEIFSKKEKYTEEQWKAYRQTMATLSYVGSYLNKGFNPMMSIGKLDGGLQSVNDFEKFSLALEPVNKVSKLNIINLNTQTGIR